MSRKVYRLAPVWVAAGLGALYLYACSSGEGAGTGSGSGGTGDSGVGASSANGGSASGGEAGEGGDTNSGGSGASGAAGGSATGGSTAGRPDAGFPDVDFEYDPVDGGSETCANVTGEAEELSRPIDIIISIDNSSSMNEEIEAVQLRVNADFAQILEASGIDYRVIMVSRYGWVHQSIAGSDNPVCIGPPLGVAGCTGTNHPMLELNAPRYFHHSTDIESRNMLCRLLTSFDSPDEVSDGGSEARDSSDPHFPWVSLAPNGWQDWLRADSFKVFVAVTDDSPDGNGCGTYDDDASGAVAFDQALRAKSPLHFGAYDAGDPDANRNYAWYSIIGMVQNDPPTTPWPPTVPYQAGTCPDTGGGAGVRDGRGYQELSIMTGGLRYPSCLNDDFDAVFNAIAQGVIDRSAVPCEFEIPEVEGIIDPDAISVSYLPGGGGAAQSFEKVDSVADCTSSQVYFDDNSAPTRVLLCPEACTTVSTDPDGEISVDFGCLGS